LSYFNVYGLREDGSYSGVPIGINIILVTFVFLWQGVLGADLFEWTLYGTIILSAILNVAPLRFRKPTGIWYVANAIFVFSLTIFYVSLLFGSSGSALV
jgi:phosphatidylserine synthase